MVTVRVLITQYLNDRQPGWVEAKLVDAWGSEHIFVDKVPLFTAAPLAADSRYPQTGFLACQWVAEWQDAQGRAIITIDAELPDHVETITGATRFDVLPQQIVESLRVSFPAACCVT